VIELMEPGWVTHVSKVLVAIFLVLIDDSEAITNRREGSKHGVGPCHACTIHGASLALLLPR
jgi:hypothetical protein